MAQQEDTPGRFIMGGTYTLESGQRMIGDLGVAGGQVTIESDAVLVGDVIVAGGTLDISGRIEGDVAAFGGQVTLAETAFIDGDVVAFGGTLNRSPGAVITGEVGEGGQLDFPGWRGLPLAPDLGIIPGPSQQIAFQTSPGQWLAHLLLRFFRAAAMILAMGGLALVVSLFWPKGIEEIGGTVVREPVLTLLVGLLTWVVAAAAGIVMVLTLCLIPAALLLILAMVVAAVLAWISAGWIVGRRLLVALKAANPTVVLEATLGTVLLALVYFLVSFLPCVDFIFGTAVASFGLGAIVLTRFGTRSYQARRAPEPADMPPGIPAAAQVGDVPAISAAEPVADETPILLPPEGDEDVDDQEGDRPPVD
jgi:hypothetical protein